MVSDQLPRAWHRFDARSVWELSRRWYGDRMSPSFRGRSAGDAIMIFARSA